MKKRTVITFSAAFMLCAFSFFLPGGVLAIRDMSLLRSTETVAVDEVELSLLSGLDTARKLQIAGDSSAAAVPLRNGRAMTESEAVESAIDAQRGMGLYLGDGETSEASARLVVSGQGESMVLWDVEVRWPTGMTGRYLVDDETGALLGMELRSAASEPAEDGADELPLSESSGEPDKEMAVGLPGTNNSEVEVIEGFAALDPGAAAERGEPTDTEVFHDVAEAFLDPLELECLLISIEDWYSVLVHVESGSGRVVIPMTVRTDGEGFISVNMDAADAYK